MQSHNPFGQPAAPTVDRLLGKSYHVVKTVYLNLPLLKEINSNEAIKFVAENFESIVLIEQNLDVLKNISESMDILKDIPKIQKEIEQQKLDSLKAISTAAQNEIKNLASVQETIKANLNSYTNDLLDDLAIAASSAMYSIRYSKEIISSANTYDIDILQPKNNIKVGDHIIDPKGNYYQIEALTDTTFTIGTRLTSLRGPEGLPGTGLEIIGEISSAKELESIIGNSGDAYFATDTSEVYIWDVNKKKWVNIGALKGNKGDPGLSANEILMSPDPVDYFNKIYGETDIITGNLIVDISGTEPDTIEIFNAALEVNE